MTREERRAIDAAYYAANREKRLAQQAAYNASHREEKAAYRAAHKEEQAAYNAAYYHAHREELLACAAAYYQENGDAILEEQRQECAEFHEWLQILRTNNGCEDCETHSGRLLSLIHISEPTRRTPISYAVF